MNKSYKIDYLSPPQGLTILEGQNGYKIDINTIDWNVFGLWFIFSSIFIFFTSYTLHTRIYAFLIPAAVFLYLSSYTTSFTFIRATIILEKNIFRFYTRRVFSFRRRIHEMDLARIQSLRLKGITLVSGGRHVWSPKGSSYIELKGKQKSDDSVLMVYRREYTIYVARFLQNYLLCCQ